MSTVPLFLLHCYISLPPPYTLASTVCSTPLHHPSLYPNIYVCLSPFPSFTINVAIFSQPLCFPPCTAPFFSHFKVREGENVPGEMLFVFGGRGRGCIVSEGRGSDLVRGWRGGWASAKWGCLQRLRQSKRRRERKGWEEEEKKGEQRKSRDGRRM